MRVECTGGRLRRVSVGILVLWLVVVGGSDGYAKEAS